MDIGAGITFGNGVGITKQPIIYLFGTLGGSGTNTGSNIVVDSSDNMYTCGSSSNNSDSIVIAKYDSLGSLQWQKYYRRNSGSSARGTYASGGMTIDSSSNIYFTGYWNGPNGLIAMFISVTSSGTTVWATQTQYQQDGVWNSIAVDSSANPYVTGYANDYNGSNNASKWTIARWIPVGGTSWWLKFGAFTGSTAIGIGTGIVTDSSNNVYVTGYANYSGTYDMYIAKFNSSGTVQWQQRFYSASTDYIHGITLDTSGNVYIVGESDVGGNYNIIIAKYNNSGTIQWQRSLSGASIENGYGIAVDSSANVYITGNSNTGGTYDLIIAKYDTSGTIQWQRKLTGVTGTDSGQAIRVATSTDGTPILYVAGYVGASGSSDMIIAKLPVDGTGVGTFTLGSYTLTYSATSFTSATSTLTSETSTLAITTGSKPNESSNEALVTTSLTSSTAQFVPSVAGAPTVGTATATSDTTATVTFTAPANNGYSTITSYTATSSPAGGTGTLSQAGSGTINVTGLTGSTSYTFTVTATNTIGTSSPSAASNSITTDVTPPSYKAIFGYGLNSSGVVVSMTNLVSNTGVVASDTTGVGTSRNKLAAAGYGTDKAIFGYGSTDQNSNSDGVSMTNLVTNTGVVGNDVTGVGTARNSPAATGYGTDKAIFGFGVNTTNSMTAITNLVSNTGVVATDTVNALLVRFSLAAARYGSSGQALFGYGVTGAGISALTNLISNTGVVASDTTGVGTPRTRLAAAGYGTDKAIFGYGDSTTYGGGAVSMTNLVSNTGVVATDTTGVGTGRYGLAAAGYGSSGQALFGYGQTAFNIYTSMTNLVSNTGVVSTDTTGVGTTRSNLAAASYGT
jgi:hypothetical protein